MKGTLYYELWGWKDVSTGMRLWENFWWPERIGTPLVKYFVVQNIKVQRHSQFKDNEHLDNKGILLEMKFQKETRFRMNVKLSFFEIWKNQYNCCLAILYIILLIYYYIILKNLHFNFNLKFQINNPKS